MNDMKVNEEFNKKDKLVNLKAPCHLVNVYYCNYPEEDRMRRALKVCIRTHLKGFILQIRELVKLIFKDTFPNFFGYD